MRKLIKFFDILLNSFMLIIVINFTVFGLLTFFIMYFSKNLSVEDYVVISVIAGVISVSYGIVYFIKQLILVSEKTFDKNE
jgi:hypothetical protein